MKSKFLYNRFFESLPQQRFSWIIKMKKNMNFTLRRDLDEYMEASY